MEKEIVWTEVAQKDFWQITAYLKENWTDTLFNKFSKTLFLKVQLLQKHPGIGFKSTKYSRFRKNTYHKTLHAYLFYY